MAYRRPDGRAASVVEEAVAALKAGLRRGDYVPGQRLVVAELERDLGLSSAALREAFSLLAGQGIVELSPHRGAQIRRLDADALAETYEMREALEGMAARLAARRADAAARTALREALAASDTTALAGDLPAFIGANHAFHAAIYAASRRPRLAEAAEALSLPLDRLTARRLGAPEVMAAAAAEHRSIAAAILAADEDRAEMLMRDHVRRSGEAIRGVALRDAALPVRRAGQR
jgi:DNA-binding GntR family transcriptional regulator